MSSDKSVRQISISNRGKIAREAADKWKLIAKAMDYRPTLITNSLHSCATDIDCSRDLVQRIADGGKKQIDLALALISADLAPMVSESYGFDPSLVQEFGAKSPSSTTERFIKDLSASEREELARSIASHWVDIAAQFDIESEVITNNLVKPWTAWDCGRYLVNLLATARVTVQKMCRVLKDNRLGGLITEKNGLAIKSVTSVASCSPGNNDMTKFEDAKSFFKPNYASQEWILLRQSLNARLSGEFDLFQFHMSKYITPSTWKRYQHQYAGSEISYALEDFRKNTPDGLRAFYWYLMENRLGLAKQDIDASPFRKHFEAQQTSSILATYIPETLYIPDAYQEPSAPALPASKIMSEDEKKQLDATVQMVAEHSLLKEQLRKMEEEKKKNTGQVQIVTLERKKKNACVVCMEEDENGNGGAEFAVIPCNQICLCKECATNGKFDTCPMCRGPVHSIQRMFFC